MPKRVIRLHWASVQNKQQHHRPRKTMPYQNISATVSAADLQAVKDAIATIQQKLPFLVNLTADERKAIFKTGPNSLSFVQNALQAALNNPDIFPKSFDVIEFGSDVNL